MHYIILGVVVIIGIIAMIASYIKTPNHTPTKLSGKLVNTDISLETAMDELTLVNVIEEDSDVVNDDNDSSNTND